MTLTTPQAYARLPTSCFHQVAGTTRIARSAGQTQLSAGMRSDAVAMLQTLVRSLGYLDVVTGYFGPKTEDAVRQLQSAHGLPVTGVYGPLTRAALARRIH